MTYAIGAIVAAFVLTLILEAHHKLSWWNKRNHYWWGRSPRKMRGSVLLEFALVAPLFLLICLGGMDILWMEITVADLDHIAAESAMCIDQSGCDPVALAQANAGGLGLNPQALTTTVSNKTITLNYQFQPLTGFVIQPETLTRSATAP